MAIPFDEVPAGTLVPFTYVEIASAGGAGAGAGFRSVLIGQKLAAGTAVANMPIVVDDAADARAKAGQGSMLAIMCEAFRRANPRGRLWAIPLADAGGATQQVQTITVGAAATGAGVIALYIGGRRVPVTISGAMTTAQVATAINTAIVNAGGASTGGVLPVSSTVSAAIVTVTTRNGGAAAAVDIRDSYQPDESLPPGVTLAYAQTTAGATDPNITGATDAIDDDAFNVIGHAYNAAASMTALETALATRWNASNQLDGMAYTAYRGTAAAATTYGNARNSRFSSVQGISTSPMSVPEWAGAIAGAVALSAAADPARPIQDVELPGILPAAIDDRFSHALRETLLADGIATHTVDQSGVVRLERMVTTYQTGPGGVADAAFRDSETLFTLSFMRASLRNRLQTKYSRFKLANNGTRVGPGQRVVTPSIVRSEIVALAREWENLGLMEDATAFKAGLEVERNSGDPNRLDILVTPDLINQLRVKAARIAFRN